MPDPPNAVNVYLDRGGGAVRRVGTLAREGRGMSSAVRFVYDDAWLRADEAFSLGPDLPLFAGPQFSPLGLPGIFQDAAPDRWGRSLMERREAIAARAERRRQRRLDEWDFLLGVHDETRMGALRLEHADAYIAADSLGVPPSTRLRELESLAAEFEGGVSTGVSEEQRWVAMLIAPGSSLGGSRPKANFLDPAGALWLAKFPSRSDRSDVGAWEAVSATLARRAGIAVADFSLRRLANPYATFCTARFDRASDGRIAYASAMTAAQKRDGEEASYLDLAEAIENFVEPQSVAADLEQLFRRVVFNVRTANRDDHLRNHGFLRGARGWRLAPAFDVNPTPERGEHALRLNDALGPPEMELVLETRHFYRLKESRAVDIVNEVDGAITGWRSVAESFGITREEIDRFGDLVFEAQQTR